MPIPRRLGSDGTVCVDCVQIANVSYCTVWDFVTCVDCVPSDTVQVLQQLSL